MPHRSVLDLLDDLERDVGLLRGRLLATGDVEPVELDNLRLAIVRVRQIIERDISRPHKK